MGRISYPRDWKNAADARFSGSINAANILSPRSRRTRSHARTGIAGQLVPQERWHQCEGRKPREREESHADVGFAARDVSSGVRRRELGVQIDEEIETDFVGRDLSQGVEILVDVHELLRLDV